MNNELKEIFTEQIAQNIQQAKQEMENEKYGHSEGFRQEHISTAIDNTPPNLMYKGDFFNQNYHDNAPSSNMRSIDDSQGEMFHSGNTPMHYSEHAKMNTANSKDAKHTYSTPGPILINPHHNERRTIPKLKDMKKPKGVQSCASINMEPSVSHRPYINPQSNKLANRKRVVNTGTIHNRLHKAALHKQKIERKNQYEMTQNSYEASSAMNNSFNGKPSTQRQGRSLVQSAKTQRNRTPINYGEKLYLNGIKKIEENKRRHHKEKLEQEMRGSENLTFRPQINPISVHNQKANSKKLEDRLLERGKKTQDMIEK
jgi:hypothetical protein